MALAERTGTDLLEQVLVYGDLAALGPEERLSYYRRVCESLGLNPLTKPFEYIELNGKLTLYALRTTTDQLRSIHQVSVQIVSRELVDSVYVVTARATMPDGRTDESVGAVPLVREGGEWKTSQNNRRYFAGNGTYNPLPPEDRSNAMMKAETKAKRRVTLSIVGLGWLDETEVDSIQSARPIRVDQDTGEIQHFVQRGPITPPPDDVIEANRESQGLTRPEASRSRPAPMPPQTPPAQPQTRSGDSGTNDASTRFWKVAKRHGSSWYEPLLQKTFGSTDFGLLDPDEQAKAADLVEAEDAK